jgi:hypothetical protein
MPGKLSPLCRLVSSDEITDFVFDQIGIKQNIGEGGAGAGVFAKNIEFPVNLPEVVVIDLFGNELDGNLFLAFSMDSFAFPPV